MALCTSPNMHRPTNPVSSATLHVQSVPSLVYLSTLNEFVEVIGGDRTANAPWRCHIKTASNVSAIGRRTPPSRSAFEKRDRQTLPYYGACPVRRGSSEHVDARLGCFQMPVAAVPCSHCAMFTSPVMQISLRTCCATCILGRTGSTSFAPISPFLQPAHSFATRAHMKNGAKKNCPSLGRVVYFRQFRRFRQQ